ncbi:hypothetical protein OAM67_00300 [bacterium]|nr:hypothetical protein [bacterium]
MPKATQWVVLHKNGSTKTIKQPPNDATLVFDNGIHQIYDAGSATQSLKQVFELSLEGLVSNLLVFRSVYYPKVFNQVVVADSKQLETVAYKVVDGLVVGEHESLEIAPFDNFIAYSQSAENYGKTIVQLEPPPEAANAEGIQECPLLQRQLGRDRIHTASPLPLDQPVSESDSDDDELKEKLDDELGGELCESSDTDEHLGSDDDSADEDDEMDHYEKVDT